MGGLLVCLVCLCVAWWPGGLVAWWRGVSRYISRYFPVRSLKPLVCHIIFSHQHCPHTHSNNKKHNPPTHAHTHMSSNGHAHILQSDFVGRRRPRTVHITLTHSEEFVEREPRQDVSWMDYELEELCEGTPPHHSPPPSAPTTDARVCGPAVFADPGDEPGSGSEPMDEDAVDRTTRGNKHAHILKCEHVALRTLSDDWSFVEAEQPQVQDVWMELEVSRDCQGAPRKHSTMSASSLRPTIFWPAPSCAMPPPQRFHGGDLVACVTCPCK